MEDIKKKESEKYAHFLISSDFPLKLLNPVTICRTVLWT